MYKNFLATLAGMSITPIEALGLEPDTYLHEPVGMQPTDDDSLKGKIIQEFERGFVYEKDGQKTVVTTSKVVIGQ
jgi:molecular chaperone GrpE (heat shock protein)